MRNEAQSVPPVAVVMGVCGSGKSSVAEALAGRLGVEFRDADTFHPQANIDKMSAGHPLDDHDREPWLDAIGAWLSAHRAAGAIATCSSLKRAYRDRLRQSAPEVRFLHLDGPRDVVLERVASRPDHFMPTSLVDSQYADLEPLQSDEIGLRVDFVQPIESLVDEFALYLNESPLQ